MQDMTEMFEDISRNVLAFLPELLAAIAILLVGTLVAWGVSALARRALARTKWDDRLARRVFRADQPGSIDVSGWTGKIVFWFLMIFVLVATLHALELGAITRPVNEFLSELLAFLPNLLGALLLLAIAWLVANAVRLVISRVLAGAGVDQRVAEGADLDPERADRAVSVETSIAEAVHWLVYLLFLPAILSALDLGGLLDPVREMTNELLGVLPNLLGAGLILLIGWFVARLVRRIVTNLLAAAGTDEASDRLGVSALLGDQKLSWLVGLVVYVLIFIPVVVAALNALELDAVTEPASRMLDTVLFALPQVFAAVLVLAIAYGVGRIVANLATNFLEGVGFDRLFRRLAGTGSASRAAASSGPVSSGQRAGAGGPDTPSARAAVQGMRPSEVAGHVLLASILLFAGIEALELLGFAQLAELLSEFLVFAGQVLLGLVIFGLGLWLAGLAARAIESSGAREARLLASIARAAILILAGAIALRQMGVANEIIVLAFGLLLGAVAVAAALAFGLGARETAGELARDWVSAARERSGVPDDVRQEGSADRPRRPEGPTRPEERA